jgi:hypothetical protein
LTEDLLRAYVRTNVLAGSTCNKKILCVLLYALKQHEAKMINAPPLLKWYYKNAMELLRNFSLMDNVEILPQPVGMAITYSDKLRFWDYAIVKQGRKIKNMTDLGWSVEGQVMGTPLTEEQALTKIINSFDSIEDNFSYFEDTFGIKLGTVLGQLIKFLIF